MKKILSLILFPVAILLSSASIAGEPTCHTHSSGPYCSYTGQVKELYINEHNAILLYFDTALPSGAPASVGINGVVQRTATLVRLDSNPDFAKLFYSTALAALASGKTVKIHMRGESGSYLKADRIWILQ